MADASPTTPPVEPPIRVLIIVKQRSARIWQEAWDEPEKIISEVLKHLKYGHLVSPDDKYNNSDCRFIAVERWDSVVFIVFDLFNVKYNHHDAHLDGKNELPVQVVRVSQGDQNHIIKTRESQGTKLQETKRLGDEVRELHDMHGWDEGVPYKVDHANGAYPIYYNPRSMST